MMKKVNIKKFFVFVLSVILLCMLITGCGNENAESNSSSLSESTVPSESTSEVEPISSPEPVKPNDVYLSGTKYGGLDISGMTYKEALEASESLIKDYTEKLNKHSVTIKADEETSILLKGNEVTFKDKTETKLAEIIVHDLKGDFDLALEFKTDTIEELLTGAFKDFEIEPKDAVITGVSDGVVQFEKAVEGKSINMQKTSELISKSLIKLDKNDIVPEFDVIEPELTDEMVSNYTCIGYCATTINTGQYESIYNMKLAMEILDERVVNPGDSLSFMKYMDYVDSYGGFMSGNIIMNGILVPASGGGICQASTTIYGVALDSGMTIIDRDNHGIPSSYVKLGLDAMVSAGSSDFIFRNDYEYPVILDTSYGTSTLYARIYGLQPEEWDDIACDAWVTNTYPATEGVRFIVDPDLEEGEFVLQNDSAKGYSTAAQRYYYKDGELVKVENLTNSYYPPRQKTYTIGKDTDTTTLENGSETRDEGKIEPSPSPSESPSPSPEVTPSESPSASPSPETTPSPEVPVTPTPTPSPAVTETPTEAPTEAPTETPTEAPTEAPVVSDHPSDEIV